MLDKKTFTLRINEDLWVESFEPIYRYKLPIHIKKYEGDYSWYYTKVGCRRSEYEYEYEYDGFALVEVKVIGLFYENKKRYIVYRDRLHYPSLDYENKTLTYQDNGKITRWSSPKIKIKSNFFKMLDGWRYPLDGDPTGDFKEIYK